MSKCSTSELRPAPEYKQIFLIQTSEYPNHIEIFLFLLTDRRMPTVWQLLLSIRLTNNASIFTAEIAAFWIDLTGIRKMDIKQAIIFSDSLPCLQDLKNGKSDHPFILEILRFLQRHLSNCCNILFCWVLGHTGIRGNTKADATAKAALDKDVRLMIKQGINLYVCKLWQLAWGVQVDNKQYSLRPCVGTNTPPCLTRRDEVVILLITSHIQILSKVSICMSASCGNWLGVYRFTTNYILYDPVWGQTYHFVSPVEMR